MLRTDFMAILVSPPPPLDQFIFEWQRNEKKFNISDGCGTTWKICKTSEIAHIGSTIFIERFYVKQILE